MGITKEQQEVIEYGKGSLLVEAGPGSGKTFVIVNRLCFHAQNCSTESIVLQDFKMPVVKKLFFMDAL